MNTLAVAMSAKAGTLEHADVATLQVKAEQLLDHSDPLFFAINDFATQFELHRRDPSQWAALGEVLHHKLDVAVTPPPPDLDRADIHG